MAKYADNQTDASVGDRGRSTDPAAADGIVVSIGGDQLSVARLRSARSGDGPSWSLLVQGTPVVCQVDTAASSTFNKVA
jgi:hypothetical protein